MSVWVTNQVNLESAIYSLHAIEHVWNLHTHLHIHTYMHDAECCLYCSSYYYYQDGTGSNITTSSAGGSSTANFVSVRFCLM